MRSRRQQQQQQQQLLPPRLGWRLGQRCVVVHRCDLPAASSCNNARIPPANPFCRLILLVLQRRCRMPLPKSRRLPLEDRRTMPSPVKAAALFSTM
jgi:hypothetical protein